MGFGIIWDQRWAQSLHMLYAEAVFADIGHLNSLILAYTGQASFLLKLPVLVDYAFVKFMPGEHCA